VPARRWIDQGRLGPFLSFSGNLWRKIVGNYKVCVWMCLASPSSAQEKSCSGITAVRFRLRFSRQTLKVDQVLFCVFSPFAALAQLCWGVMSNAPSYGTCRESKTSRDSKDRVLGSGDVGGTSTAREQFWAISESECQAILNELHPWKLINGTRLEVWPPGVLPKDVPNSPSQWQQKSRGVHMLMLNIFKAVLNV